MDASAFSELFSTIFRLNGLERYCTEPIIASFFHLTERLTEANLHMNLTAIREMHEIISKHYADCLLGESQFPLGATVLDLGCGGGFPTFPLAIVRPDLKITALDSTNKKIAFVAHTANTLKLSNIKPVCARAEDPSLRSLYNSFDVVTSRAMARMNALCEMGLPFVRIGGTLIAYKGVQGTKELTEAANALQKLRAKCKADQEIQLKLPISQKPFALSIKDKPKAMPTDMACNMQGGNIYVETRHLLVIKKEHATPLQYPRPYATILKKPL